MRILRPSLHRFCAWVILIVAMASGCAIAQPQQGNRGPWLFQSLSLKGNQIDGFNKGCLIVFQNGDYHREQRRQYSADGHAQFEWRVPEVFEGTLSESDLKALTTVLNDPAFAATSGAVGGDRNLWSHIITNHLGEVVPQDVFDILTVAVARPGKAQIFELSDMDLARKQSFLETFLDWIKIPEHNQTHALASAPANNCSPRATLSHGPRKEPAEVIGVTPPRAVFTPALAFPPDAPESKYFPIEVLINPDGRVAQVTPEGHPDPQVAQAIREGMSKWRFEPARLVGIPVATAFVLTVNIKKH